MLDGMQNFMDAPETVLSMLWDGELTPRGLANAFFNPEDLTLAERDTIASRLKARLGDNPIAGAVADIALNPFVWMAFLFQPGTSRVLREGVGGVATLAAEHSAFVAKKTPFLMQWGLMTGNRIADGTPMGAVLAEVTRGYQQTHLESAKALGPAVMAVKQALGVDNLSPTSMGLLSEVRTGSAQVDKLKQANALLFASLEGLDRDRTVKALASIKDGKPIYRNEVVPRLIEADLDAQMRALTGDDSLVQLRDAFRNEMLNSYKRVYYNADGVVDDNAVLRVFRGLRNSLLNGQGRGSQEEAVNLIQTFLGRADTGDVGEAKRLIDKLRDGTIEYDTFKNLLVEAIEAPLQSGAYMPRNLARYVDATWRDVPREVLQGRMQDAAFSTTRSSYMRQRGLGLYDPNQLEDLAKRIDGAPTAEMQNYISSVREEISKTASENGVARIFSIDPDEQIHRYLNQMAKTYAWHRLDVPESVLAAQRAAFKDPTVRAAIDETYNTQVFGDARQFTPGKSGNRADIRTVFNEVSPEDAPLGGFSLADAMLQSYTLIPNQYRKNAIAQVMVPMTTGSVPIERATSTLSMMRMKEGVRWFVTEGPMRDLSDESTFKQGLLRWSDPDRGINALSNNTSRGLADWLYKTHLGLNPSSIMLQLVQPWTGGATLLGQDAVLYGMGKAGQELSEYASLRLAKYGARRITTAERTDLIQSVFKYGGKETAGDDVIDITNDFFQRLDDALIDVKGYGTRKETLLDMTMKGFEKAEWFNRAAIAHATEYRWAKAGRMALGGAPAEGLIGDIRRVVQETQFSSGPMNTPIGFLSDNPALGSKLVQFFGNNRLLRQFMTFPVRTAIGAFETWPKMGGGQWTFAGIPLPSQGALGGAASAFALSMRALGVSAIVYEAGKNLLGTDLSRGLFWNSATDLGRGIWEAGPSETANPFPVPPIIDIPIDLVRGTFYAAQGDYQLLQQAISRTIPGGIALSRVMGYLPSTTPDAFTPLSSQGVDFSAPTVDQETGKKMYPVLDSKGLAVEYVTPLEATLRATGLSTGKQETAKLDRFMTRQGEQIREYRRRAINALLSNDVAQYTAIGQEFQKRFGAPLSITQQHLKMAIENRTTPRGARILERTPPEMRARLMEALSPAQRAAIGSTPQSPGLEMNNRDLAIPVTQETLRRAEPFSGFDGFTTQAGF